MKHKSKIKFNLLAASVGLTASLLGGQVLADEGHPFFLEPSSQCGTVSGFSFTGGALTVQGLTGCALGGVAPPALTCGEGTVESDGACIPVNGTGGLVCGEGTTETAGVCVADNPGDLSCGYGTVPTEGKCEILVCESGKELDEEGKSCVVIPPTAQECEAQGLVLDGKQCATPTAAQCEARDQVLENGKCVTPAPDPSESQPGGVNKSWSSNGLPPYLVKEEWVGNNAGTYHYYKIQTPANAKDNTIGLTVVPYSGANGASFNMWISETIGGTAVNRCDSVKSQSGTTITALVNHSGGRASSCKIDANKTYYLNVADGVGGRYSWDEEQSTCQRAAGCQYRINGTTN